MNEKPNITLCLDVGITQTRAWAMRSGKIVAQSNTLEGIRGSTSHPDRSPAIEAIKYVISECLRQLNRTDGERHIDFVAAAGMVTSELGPYPVSHIEGPAGMHQLSQNVVSKGYVEELGAPLFLVPGIRFGGNEDVNRSDAIRGEETLVTGLLIKGHLAPGDALLNLGSHWKLISTSNKSEIVASFTGLGGELILAISKETILKGNLPGERPERLISESVREGRLRYGDYGLGRSLFLFRMDSQRRNLSANQLYWQLVGALIEDNLRSLHDHLKPTKRIAISGYGPLAQAWAETLSQVGIDNKILSSSEVEESFCTGLEHIVAPLHH